MGKSRRQRIWERADGCCEYCRIPQEFDVRPFQVDHIRAQKHGGPSTLGNLALSCLACNAAKGPNIAGYDSDDDSVQRLFDPRRDIWSEHFRWDGAKLAGRSAIGRVTIAVLGINDPDRVEHRSLLIEAGLFVPVAHD